MAAFLTVIWWRDIPAQVIARDGRQSHKIVLHPRFQVAIDRAAVKAGLREWNGYLEQWRKDQRACSADVKAEAVSEAARLEAEYPKEALNRLVETLGIDGPDNDGGAATDHPNAAGPNAARPNAATPDAAGSDVAASPETP